MSTEETEPLLDTEADNTVDDEASEQFEMVNINKEASTSSGSAYTKGLNKKYEETSFGGEPSGELSEAEKEYLEKERRKDEALAKIKARFPKFNPAKSTFTFDIDYKGDVIVRLKTEKAINHVLIDVDGNINEKIIRTSKKIKASLGARAEKVVETNEEEIARHKERIDELQDELATTSDEHMRDNLNQTISEEQDAVNQLERANEEIEQRMELRDRVKAIFKKYGFTVLAVASAVGVVIGVIVANLKNGLTSLGKGGGNGLKTIGKKLGEILPGLVGAIASFVFRTAGEVVGFLAKNAWLLIVGVVIYLVEQFKKKKVKFKNDIYYN